MGFFADNNLNVGDASPTAGGLYFQPGQYKVRVDRVKMVKSQTNGRDFFTVETTVLESDNEKLPEGRKPSWLVELPGKFPETALGNVKNFLLAGYGYLAKQAGEPEPTIAAIGNDEADAATGEENILAGVVLDVNAFNKVTKAGSDFTRVVWS